MERLHHSRTPPSDLREAANPVFYLPACLASLWTPAPLLAGQSKLLLRHPGNSRSSKLCPQPQQPCSLSSRYSMRAALLLLLRHGLACSRGGLLLHLYLSILKVAFLQSLNTYLMECVLLLSDGHTSWQAMGALPDVYSRIFGRLDQTVTIHWIGHAVRRAASQLGASRASSGAAASASIAGAEHTGQRTRGIWRLPKLGGGWGIRATDIRLPPLLPGVPFRDAYQVCHI